jgi:hypothetical protein
VPTTGDKQQSHEPYKIELKYALPNRLLHRIGPYIDIVFSDAFLSDKNRHQGGDNNYCHNSHHRSALMTLQSPRTNRLHQSASL